MSRKKIAVAAVMAGGLLALPGATSAHVTLQPDSAPAGGFTRLDVRVPNERDNKGTVKVDVQFPPGFVFVSYEPVPGWTVKVTKRKLAEPRTEHGEEITEEVGRVTWTGDGQTGIIGPGQFKDFGLSVGVPDEPDSTLTFKALQTYEGGEVVRWVGAPDADEPAPQVSVTAAEEEHHGAGAEEEEEPEEAAPASAEAGEGEDEDEDEDGNGLAVAALIVGGLGLVTGTAGLLRSRR